MAVNYRLAVNVASCVTFLFTIIVMAAPWVTSTSKSTAAGFTSSSSVSFGIFDGGKGLGNGIGFVRFLVVMVFFLAFAALSLTTFSVVLGKKIMTMPAGLPVWANKDVSIYKSLMIVNGAIAATALLAMIVYGAIVSGNCTDTTVQNAFASFENTCSAVSGGNGILTFMIFLNAGFAFLAFKANQDESEMVPLAPELAKSFATTPKTDVELQSANA